jgi:2-polyprenyl-3-methyl-5-hydroxy-6-metoxy-1,4-benzoquinol methylase
MSITQDPTSRNETLREFLYTRYVSAFKGEEGGSGIEIPPSRRRWLQHRVLPLLADVPRTGRVCELGCGNGGFLGFLKDSGFQCVNGVDWSAEQVALARSRGFDVSQGDLFDVLAASHGQFDLVVAIDVIEHLSHDQLLRFGSLMMQALRPGGMLLVQTPNGEGLFAGHVIHGDLTHCTIFNENSIKQYLRAFGFEDIRVVETAPVRAGVRGTARWMIWSIVRLVGRVAIAAESGRLPGVLTQEFLCTCRKRVPGTG